MAKQTAQKYSFDSIMRELRARRYSPVYYLMGDEPYYIDCIADYIADSVLAPEERDFNQTLLYAMDTGIDNIITMARGFPMMAEHQVIIVKEAQQLRDIERLSLYLQQPMQSTVLVFCHKNGTLDRRKKVAVEIERVGVLYESKRLRDDQLAQFAADYLKNKGVAIDPKAAGMMAEFVGNDLSRMTGELDKLTLLLPPDDKRVTPELVERNIGISKEYNNFELIEALITRDTYKAGRICQYFADNSKKNPIQMTLALLFTFFSNLMIAYYAPEKSEHGVAEFLGLKWSGMARDYLRAMRSYNGVKVMQIIGEIRDADALSKGFGTTGAADGDILKLLIYKILH